MRQVYGCKYAECSVRCISLCRLTHVSNTFYHASPSASTNPYISLTMSAVRSRVATRACCRQLTVRHVWANLNALAAHITSSNKHSRQQHINTNHQHTATPHNPNKALSTVPAGWSVRIGIEVHAQIIANTKLFSAASASTHTSHSSPPPNTHVSTIDYALPGVLPSLNWHCVQQAVATGLAVGGNVATMMQFDRKHYFYPDTPSNYQITQHHHPVITGGAIHLHDANDTVVRIVQIQLEQDSGKNVHDIDRQHTYIDYNRANCALMEIVSAPDMYSAESAVLYVRTLAALLQRIGVCTGRMESGALRCDVNVSVHKLDGSVNSDRVEVKNLNSLRSVHRAIQYETDRQIGVLEGGGSGVVQRETRTFDVVGNRTVLLRTKEQLLDYRFMPEPDIPLVYIPQHAVEYVRRTMPELPDALMNRLMSEYGLTQTVSAILVDEPQAAEYFEAVVRYSTSTDSQRRRNPVKVANWIVNDMFGRLHKLASELNVDDDQSESLMSVNTVSAGQLAELIDLVDNDSISSKHSKQLLDMLMDDTHDSTNVSVKQVAIQHNYIQVSDTAQIEQYVDTVLQQRSADVSDYIRTRNKRMIGLFVGEAVKLSDGKANARLVSQILVRRLDELSRKQ